VLRASHSLGVGQQTAAFPDLPQGRATSRPVARLGAVAARGAGDRRCGRAAQVGVVGSGERSLAVDVVVALALLLMASGVVLIAVGFMLAGRQEEPSEGPGYRVNGAR
jgi:hypothetical protein